MHWQMDAALLALVIAANGTPILGRIFWPNRLAGPLHSHLKWPRRKPIFASSKTRRGFILAICTAPLAAVLVNLSWTIGFAVGLSSMCGDLFSSFLKRRLGSPPSSRTTFLDQVPESLFPCLV